MYENKRFVIGKLNFVSYQFVLGAFPLEPRNSLDFEMSQHTYTVCVKGGEHGLKMPSINKKQISTTVQNAQLYHILGINCTNKYNRRFHAW